MTVGNTQANETGRVLRFRPRDAPKPDGAPAAIDTTPRVPIDDIGKYERDSAGDDYRLRMLNNALAFVVCVGLVIGGVWLAIKLAEMRKNQDCVLSGRRGCTPVEVPAGNRW